MVKLTMTPQFNNHLQTVIGAVITALAMYGVSVQPALTETNVAVAERDEFAATSQVIREELQSCLAELKECWKECR